VTRRRRILEVILAPTVAGAETLVAGLDRVWRRQGHEVEIIALDPPGSAGAAKAATDLFGRRLPLARAGYRGSRPLLKQSSRLLGLADAFRTGQYDVVHAHALQPNMYARAARILTRVDVPVIVTLHSASDELDYANRFVRLSERALQHQAAAVVAVSPRAGEWYRQAFPRSRHKVAVIPNGIPWDTTSEGAHRSPPKVFLALCRISPQKDIETMLDGFDQFWRGSTHPVTLLIAGAPLADSDYADRIMARRESLTCAADVQFLGPRADVPDLLGYADVFVHTAKAENHPIAILEAASAKLPVVAARIPEVERCLGPAGYYFTPGESKGLATALHAVVNDWPKARSQSESVSKHVRSEYSMTLCAERYMQQIKAVTA
jgi:L-malate glycosyltransferase